MVQWYREDGAIRRAQHRHVDLNGLVCITASFAVRAGRRRRGGGQEDRAVLRQDEFRARTAQAHESATPTVIDKIDVPCSRGDVRQGPAVRGKLNPAEASPSHQNGKRPSRVL